MSGAGAHLEIRGLTKQYPLGKQKLSVLAGLDLVARPGEFVSVIGPSGCGKSTLFNIVAGLESPDGGRVLLDGHERPRLGTVGYMPQKDLLLPWRSVLDNVTLGLELAGASRREARETALPYLDQFGLAGFAHSFPATLSGGMRQRAALLRTFLPRKPLLLLDEPLGALDALTRMQLQAWLLAVWQTLNTTILFITHDVDEAVFLSDRVYVLGPRPATIQAEEIIDLPRPRDPEMLTAPRFVEHKRALLRHLRAALAAGLESGTPAASEVRR